MEKRLYHHPQLGEITLASSARNRRITLSVKPSGAVRLSFPPSVSVARALNFLEERAAWVEGARRRMAARQIHRPTLQLTPNEIEALRLRAKAELPPRVETLARIHGFHYGRITIRAARSKWGCCTSQNNLSLSLYLMLLPDHLRDFVLLHELCHTVHHNHSAAFHALLNCCVDGQEATLNQELKTYSLR